MSMADFNTRVINEFRENAGVVGGMFDGMPLLLLHHVGAKSGTDRVSPLVYLEDDGNYVIFASKGGAPENPAWYHNLQGHPETKVEVAGREVAVTAHEAEGAERDRLYETQAAVAPQFAEYAQKTSRTIPVVVLTPKG